MKAKQNEYYQSIQSIERALNMLELLSDTMESMSAIDISKKLNINRTTTYGILNTLVHKNYVVKAKSGSKYFIGTKLFELGSSYPYKLPLALYAAPYMTELQFKHDVSVRLAIQREIGYYMILSARVPVRSAAMRLGEKIPSHASALGKVMLAYMPQDQLNTFLDTYDFHKYTSATITNKEALLAELEEIRVQGYGFDKGEQFANMFCLGFPIFDTNNEVVAALSLSDTMSGITEKQDNLIRDGLQFSKYISLDYGWKPLH